MKKVLLFIISLFFVQSAQAYETVLIDFPENQGWHAVYYATQDNESILQYVPTGQDENNWTRTMVFHSYRYLNQTSNAAAVMDKTTMQMENKNSSSMYRYLKYNNMDSLATRCVEKNAYIPRQCEIYRVSTGHESIITMHYINKNVQDFKNSYDFWLKIMRDIRIYYSYYRTDRILDKATSFEL